MTRHILAQIQFYEKQEGGIALDYTRDFYHCPAVFEGIEHMCDCRIDLTQIKTLQAGDLIEAGVGFLDYDTVKKFLHEGDTFKLYNGRIIGEAVVLKKLK